MNLYAKSLQNIVVIGKLDEGANLPITTIFCKFLAYKIHQLIVDGIGIGEVKFINALNLLGAKLNSQIVK